MPSHMYLNEGLCRLPTISHLCNNPSKLSWINWKTYKFYLQMINIFVYKRRDFIGKIFCLRTTFIRLNYIHPALSTPLMLQSASDTNDGKNLLQLLREVAWLGFSWSLLVLRLGPTDNDCGWTMDRFMDQRELYFYSARTCVAA